MAGNGAAAELPSVVLHGLRRASKLPAKVNDHSGASRGATRGGIHRHDGGAGEASFRRAVARPRSWPGRSPASCRRCAVEQFKGGQSNPTYRLTDGAGRRYVLRRKPPGKLLPSAHAVDREFRVISALNKTDVPTPDGLRAVRGRQRGRHRLLHHGVLRRPGAVGPAAAGGRRRRAGWRSTSAKFETLARLHAVDYAALGPGRFRPARQLCRAPDLALGQAVQGVRDRDDRGDGPAARLAAGPPAAQRRDGAGPWRLPARQHGLPSDRAEGAGRHRLGDLDPRRSAGRALLPLHAVAHAEGLGRPGGP